VKQAFDAPAPAPLSAISSPFAAKRSSDDESALTHAAATNASSMAAGARPKEWENLTLGGTEPHRIGSGHETAFLYPAPGVSLPKAAALALLLMLSACKPPPEERHHMPQANAARGREIIGRVGCASCHTIPGIRWPEGRVGPDLHGFANSNLIAGELPNRPDILAAYVRQAPAVLPGTTMPAMPISEGEARDVAAYLYTLEP
jgi:mono/diheme cytochrome c family protein